MNGVDHFFFLDKLLFSEISEMHKNLTFHIYKWAMEILVNQNQVILLPFIHIYMYFFFLI